MTWHDAQGRHDARVPPDECANGVLAAVVRKAAHAPPPRPRRGLPCFTDGGTETATFKVSLPFLVSLDAPPALGRTGHGDWFAQVSGFRGRFKSCVKL